MSIIDNIQNQNQNIIQENNNFQNSINNNFNNNLDMYSIRQNIRYKLVSQSTQQNFIKWISQNNTMDLIDKLIEQTKNNSMNVSNPSPIFVSKSYNQLNTSQSAIQQNSLMPPVSPNTSVLFNTLNDKKNMLTESQILDERSKKVLKKLKAY